MLLLLKTHVKQNERNNAEATRNNAGIEAGGPAQRFAQTSGGRRTLHKQQQEEIVVHGTFVYAIFFLARAYVRDLRKDGRTPQGNLLPGREQHRFKIAEIYPEADLRGTDISRRFAAGI